jgi:hypothetical protein
MLREKQKRRRVSKPMGSILRNVLEVFKYIQIFKVITRFDLVYFRAFADEYSINDISSLLRFGTISIY